MPYCHDIYPETEEQVAEILRRISRALEQRAANRALLPRAVVLGGGYGRGEGGVFTAPDGSRHLYNDLDLFVFVPDAMTAAQKADLRRDLSELERPLSEEFQVEVEFGPPTPVGKLPQLAPTLMYQELRRGFVPVWGAVKEVMEHLPQLDFPRLPEEETMRLLLNRGAGLLLAWRELTAAPGEKQPDSAGFAARNIQKAALAIGDAYLLCRKHYIFGGEQRLRLLNQEPDVPADAKRLYAAALDFKYAPTPEKCRQAASSWGEVRDQWRIAANLFAPKPQPARESAGIIRKCKNILLNLRYFPRFGWSGCLRHPRWHLMEILPGLLLDKALPDKYIKGNCEKGEMAAGTNFPEADLQFLRLWRRFN